MFRNSAIVGIRKPLPPISKKLGDSDNAYVTIPLEHVGNLIDVASSPHPVPQRVKWNASGRFVIDFIFSPLQCSLRISIQYKHIKMREPITTCHEYGITISNNDEEYLDDDELEVLLRS